MPRALIWFRSDLRTHDSRALAAACAQSDEPPLGVFLIAKKQWKRHNWGANRSRFTLECARELAQALARHGVELIVRNTPTFEDAPDELLKIAKKHACSALHYNIEYEVNELARDDNVRETFEDAETAVHAHHDQMMGAAERVRTGADEFYRVFTPFSKAWFSREDEQDAHSVVEIDWPKAKAIDPKDAIAALEDAMPKANADLSAWPAGEDAALKRLKSFIKDRIKNYKKDRDTPSIGGTSQLSAYLATGAISARTCLAHAMDANRGRMRNGSAGIDTWIKELIWRDFYRHVLIGFPHVCRNRPMKQDAANVAWRDDDDAFEAWCEGRTGYPIVDAAMRQLTTTGWMHNRLRMIVAMFLSKHLLIDWRRGEAFFMQQLVDGDFASNNGGWQWSSSTGADAAPYFRIFNPTTQSERFDKDGEFIRQYVPELAELDAPAIHEPPELVRESCGYPLPIVEHKAARERALKAFKAS